MNFGKKGRPFAPLRWAVRRRWLLVSCCVLLLFIVGVAVRTTFASLEVPVAPYTGSEPPAACVDTRLLRLTSPPLRGDAVWELRGRLRDLGFDVGDEQSELFDATLDRAVREFQRSQGLVADGVVGQQTWEALAAGVETSARGPTTPAPTGTIEIVVDTERLTLTVYADGQPYKTYPVAVGRPKATTLTPVGEWRIIHKAYDWGGGFGTRWIGINVPWGIYGIHGTNQPYSIGNRASAGCVRMHNRDVEELFTWVSIGDAVRIVGVKRAVDFTRPLRDGVTGRDVVEVQLRLNEIGFHVGDADGRFGPATEAAVRRLQAAFSLPVDGHVRDDVYYVLGLK